MARRGTFRLVTTAAILSAVSVAALIFWTDPPPPPKPEPKPRPMPVEQPAHPRDVTPPSALPGPVVSGPLTRLPAREPPPKPPAPPEPVLLHRVVVIDGGSVRTGRDVIRIAGIRPLTIDTTCTDSEGRDWPCGQAAATELRMLIRRRSLSCAPPFGDEHAPRFCTVGTLDIGEWLIEQGWAEPADEAPQSYRSAAERAREAKAGRYGRAWGQ